MKILMLSDVHSNIWALTAVLGKEQGADILCCAGDLVDYGTAPELVLEWFAHNPEVVVVQGNHDAHTVAVWREGQFNSVEASQYKWVHHNCRRLSSEQIAYLDSLPMQASFEADGWSYLINHRYDDAYGVVESEEQFEAFWTDNAPESIRNNDKRCLVFGHTHRQYSVELNSGMRCLNPGSVSYRRPDDPDKTAQYAVIEDGMIELRSVPYNRKPQLKEAKVLCATNAMMLSELQDFFFFFGNATTTRDPITENSTNIILTD